MTCQSGDGIHGDICKGVTGLKRDIHGGDMPEIGDISLGILTCDFAGGWGVTSRVGVNHKQRSRCC